MYRVYKYMGVVYFFISLQYHIIKPECSISSGLERCMLLLCQKHSLWSQESVDHSMSRYFIEYT